MLWEDLRSLRVAVRVDDGKCPEAALAGCVSGPVGAKGKRSFDQTPGLLADTVAVMAGRRRVRPLGGNRRRSVSGA